MYNLSENHHLRQHFLNTDEVPTQSLIKSTMSPPLAAVYFKSMSSKLKVLVGLEPPMKGGGGDWYVPPEDLLAGRAVLKPVKKEYLFQLNYFGVDQFGMKVLKMLLKRMQLEKSEIIQENDAKWKAIVKQQCEEYFKKSSEEEAKKNTERIRSDFHDFTTLYTTSLTTIEQVLVDAARKEIMIIKNEAFQKMNLKYYTSMKQQATTIYDIYTNKIMADKSRLKAEFVEKLEIARTEIGEKVHDINMEKHIAIEKLRKYLECQSKACQVYVALKEREICEREIEQSQKKHKKIVKKLTEDIQSKNYEVFSQECKEKKRQEFCAVWRKKVCLVVKKFQLFVSYCLKLLPEHADFFFDMERLMLLQLNETLDNPSADSIFVVEEGFEGPKPKPHPFYLFCDKSGKNKIQVDQDLCPKRCTSSASQMPVIVINKRFMYAACDNFEQFNEKIHCFIRGKRGEDADFMDDQVYENYVPVKFTRSQQLLELKLESSLLQVLQQEIPNIRAVPIECGICKLPYCFCSPSKVTKASTHIPEKPVQQTSVYTVPSYKKIETRSAELKHEREPNWESYLRYIEPSKCGCPKAMNMKLLKEHLPIYMRKMVYSPPELPNYETCPLSTLQSLVRKARGSHPTPSPVDTTPKFRDMGTQYSDQQFEFLCTCFSDDELKRFFGDLITGSKMYDPSATDRHFHVDDTVTPSDYMKQPRSFVRGAHSLRNLVDGPHELKELFTSTGRAYD